MTESEIIIRKIFIKEQLIKVTEQDIQDLRSQLSKIEKTEGKNVQR